MKAVKAFFIFFFVLSFVSFYAEVPECALRLGYHQLDPYEIVTSINMTRVKEHVSFFGNLGSRMTGSPGCELAAKYISNTFQKYSLVNVSFHMFNATVPKDYGAHIDLPNYPDLSLDIYSLEPNLVSPVTTSGITAPVIHAPGSPFPDFDGKTINGSVVLMEFNTGINWLEAAKFGAKAVIFIEPEKTTKEEIGSKSVSLPFSFLRYYMPKESAVRLLSLISSSPEPPIVRITSRMVWEMVRGKNVLGVIPGTQTEKTIMLASYYDSYSVAPLRNPGANDACGIATLLELAHYFSLHKPKYTILFVAFSGHYQSLSGSRWLAEDYFATNSQNRTKVILMISLQLSTESDVLDLGTISGFRTEFGGAGFSFEYYYPFMNYISSLVESLNTRLEPKYHLIQMEAGSERITRRVEIPTFGLRADDVDGIAGATFSLVTRTYDEYLYSPIDTLKHLNLDNLEVQLEAIFYSLVSAASKDNLESEYLKLLVTKDGTHLWKYDFMTSGRVAFWNASLGWYQGVGSSLVVLRKSWIDTGTWGDRRPVIIKTDENGYFNIPSYGGGGGAGASGRFYGTSSMNIYAFKLDDATGNLIYAPDHGTHMFCPGGISSTGSLDLNIGYYTIFKCATAVLLDLIDPTVLGNAAVFFRFSVYDFETASSPQSHGSILRVDSYRAYTLATLFVPYDMSLSLTINTATLGKIPLGILVNATREHPDGVGYVFEPGTQQIFTPLDIVTNTYLSGYTALNHLAKYGIADPSVMKKADLAAALIKNAKVALESKQYNLFNSYVVEAWGHSHGLYAGAKNTVQDVVNTVSFFGTLLVPFTILAEAFFFGFRGLKRLGPVVTIFVAFFAYLYLFHPGFAVTSNIIMTIVGFTVLTLTIPPIGIVGGTFREAIIEWSRKVVGTHFAGLSLGSAVVLSINLGIENLKKRKLRTILVFVTVMITVMCSTMFLSLTATPVIQPGVWPKPPLYEGVYVRHDSWINSLGAKTVCALMGRYAEQALILPRSNLYTVYPMDRVREVLFTMSYANNSLRFYAVLGLTPQHARLEVIQSSLLKGRWFVPTDVQVVIISEYMAKKLGIEDVPVEVDLLSGNFTVIGIINSDVFDRIRDLDGEPITPFDNSIPEQNILHVSTKDCAILPYATTLFYPETRVSAVSIIPKPESVLEIASEIFSAASQLSVYSGAGDKTYLYAYSVRTSVAGWESQLVPFLISCLMILNIMIGSVKERSREIFTYSSVGLSPLQVCLLFLAESLIYAIVAGLLGYALALGLHGMINILYPGLIPANFASSWVMTTLGIAMLATILSTIYPMFISAKIVTPSLERRWRAPTKPGTDDWNIPLPFETKTQEEVLEMCVFLAEVLKTHQASLAEVYQVKDLRYNEDLEPERPLISLNMNVRLAPYEQGLTQDVQIIFLWNEDAEHWSLSTYIKKTGGARSVWLKMTRGFIDEIRKQLLMWRVITPKERKNYMNRIKELKEIGK